MKMKFLPDEAIVSVQEDLLGFGNFINLLKNSIYNTETPFVYGVLGDWGSGKTSVLKILFSQILEDLDGQGDVFIPIWFNAWKYENETNIIYPLIHALRQDFLTRFKGTDNHQDFFDAFQKVAIASISVLADLGLRVATNKLAGETIQLEDISKQIETFEKNQAERKIEKLLNNWADEISQIDQAFSELLCSYAQAISAKHSVEVEKVNFIFIIDDLDRCLPDTTIAILESIKNHLSVKKCIFILGLNPKVVYQGIKAKYKGLEVDGREYLEKILNYSFYVPEPRLQGIPELVKKRFDDLITESSVMDMYENLFLEFGFILEKCNFNNPRKIKRILNRYLFFLSANEHQLDKLHNSNTVRFLVLAEYFPNIFWLFLKSDEHTGLVQTELLKIGQKDFQSQEFENKFNISMSHMCSHLSKMPKLFDLNLSSAGGRIGVTEHASLIFEITPLV